MGQTGRRDLSQRSCRSQTLTAHPVEPEAESDDSLLLVIPSVMGLDTKGELHFDQDFSNNLVAYLAAFSSVTVACPAAEAISQFPGTVARRDLPHGERLRAVVLPEPYREDRYLRHRGAISRLLGQEIDRARYLLISPHAPFDWSTLAAEICIAKGRKYNMEGDWNLPQVSRHIWSKMPFGLNKLRKRLWLAYHDPKYMRCLRHSALSLLQGDDVYNSYKDIAPNPFSVLNVQITEKERIGPQALTAKLTQIRRGGPLQLVYAGRAIEIKGPMEWLGTLLRLKQQGIDFRAIWFGEGNMLEAMRAFVRENGLEQCCELPGNAPRERVFERLQQADAFLFCHMTKESPRNVVEALAAGAPLLGFGTDFTRGLVREQGGGTFTEVGNVAGLADIVARYARDREALAELTQAAAASGQSFDRDKAIQERITLMRRYL